MLSKQERLAVIGFWTRALLDLRSLMGNPSTRTSAEMVFQSLRGYLEGELCGCFDMAVRGILARDAENLPAEEPDPSLKL